MIERPRITVCGAGNAGVSIAADCSLKGFDVTLFELEKQAPQIKPIMEAGGIEVSATSSTLSGKTGYAALKCASVDPQEATAGADVIMITVPAMYHTVFFDTLAPYVKDDQIILFNTSYWACLRHAKKTKKIGKKIILAESNTMPYAAFRESGNKVHISRSKQFFNVASFPGNSNDGVYRILHKIYPQFQKAANVFEIDIASGGNPAMTVPMVLPVAGYYFDRYMGGKLYADATAMGTRLMKAYDDDRKNLAVRLGCRNYESQLEYYTHVYGATGDDMGQIMRKSNLIDWWATCDYIKQLIEEDIVFAYVPMVRLSEALEIKIGATAGMVELMGLMLNEDYWCKGASLDDMGLARLNLSQIKQFVMTGQ